MLYQTLFPSDLFEAFDQLQRDWRSGLDSMPAIRGRGRGGFPALNIGGTPTSVEVYAFAPGLEPDSIDVNVERGVLSLAGERKGMTSDEQGTLHTHERFTGGFRRVLSLSEDVDPDSIRADYRDGVLHVSMKRRESSQPRRIEIQ